jgi:hypothetical protein
MNNNFNDKELANLYKLILIITNIVLMAEPDDKDKPKRMQDLIMNTLSLDTLSSHTDEQYLNRILLELIMNKGD